MQNLIHGALKSKKRELAFMYRGKTGEHHLKSTSGAFLDILFAY